MPGQDGERMRSRRGREAKMKEEWWEEGEEEEEEERRKMVKKHASLQTKLPYITGLHLEVCSRWGKMGI